MRLNYISTSGTRVRKASIRQKVRYALFLLWSVLLCILVVTTLGKSDPAIADTPLAPPNRIGPDRHDYTDGMPAMAVMPSESPEPKNFLVALDPGHGGVDPGCAIGDAYESNINLSIADMVADALESEGFEVIMTREDDSTISIDKRVDIAEDNDADILVSIHQNSFEDDDVTCGIETWYNYKKNEHSEDLAQYIQDQILLTTDANDRGLRPDRSLIITRKADMPSCLVETGFMTNAEERAKLLDKAYQQKIADGIVAGIVKYYEKNG